VHLQQTPGGVPFCEAGALQKNFLALHPSHEGFTHHRKKVYQAAIVNALKRQAQAVN